MGEIRSRPSLSHPTQSPLALALLVSLNRNDEFRMHVRAAANSGVTREEIKEVPLQLVALMGIRWYARVYSERVEYCIRFR